MSQTARLREVLYRDHSNLNARVQLHLRFSTSHDQLELPAQAQVGT